MVVYQVFLSNINNLQLDLFKPLDVIRKDSTSGQSGPRSNSNEGVVHTPQSPRTGV